MSAGQGCDILFELAYHGDPDLRAANEGAYGAPDRNRFAAVDGPYAQDHRHAVF